MATPDDSPHRSPVHVVHGRARPSIVLSGVRCQAHEAELIRAAARRSGLALSVWMRHRLVEAATVALTRQGSA